MCRPPLRLTKRDDAPVTAPLYAIGRFCSRHHWPTIGAWIVIAVALVFAGQAGDSKTNDNLTLPGTGSTLATELLEDNLPEQAFGSNPLVFQAKGGASLTESKYAAAIGESVKRLNALHDVNSAVSPLSPEGATFLSKDRSVGYVPVILSVGPSELTEAQALAVLDAGEPAEAAGLKVSVGAYVGQQLSKPDTGASDAIGIAAAIVILLFAFGTATAMVLPIFSAVLGLACSLSLIRLLEHAVQVPSVASTLATMIGLGVGIDYALFIVTRHKLQLGDGMEMRESVARATATAGGAVVFAGFTVVIALCSLAFAGIPLVSTLGFTAAIAVVIAVAAAVTLLPAMLGALGPRINSLRVQFGKTSPTDAEPHGWRRWARGVADRPWRSAIASLAVLVVLAIPLLQLELGQNDLSALPKSTTARQAYDGLTQGFGPGVNGPLLIASEFESGGEAKTVLPVLEKKIDAAADVAEVSEPSLDKAGTAAVFTVISKSAPWADETVSLVEDLRDETIPTALKGSSTSSYVGGQTAGYIDLATQISDKLPLMIGIVVALSFIVLLLAFRSLLVPIKAAAMNLISVAAAYGVVTAVFQLGWGSSLIGLDHAIPIVSFVPLLMFAILFGLSMDYEVFLLTQMREHYRQSDDEREAVIEGLANTGRVITSAAAIMVCVFTSFVLNGNPIVKEFGVGLAVAIAIDSTLVRCLLVPAIMVLLGKRAWWMPGWLGRLVPHISIEGEDYFAARDAALPADGPKSGDMGRFEARRPPEEGE
jgi:putative drug exporter of the RND superfamily